MHEYSQNIQKYISDTISMVSTIMFQEWYDSHDKSKITRSQLRDLVEKAATKVYHIIDLNNIRTDVLLYTDEFYEWFIVNGTTTVMKKIFEDRLVQIIDNE